MEPQADDLVALLTRATLRIDLDEGFGTGVTVGPSLVLTCAHVIAEAYRSGAAITLSSNGQNGTGKVVDYLEDVDLALVETDFNGENEAHPVALLSNELSVGDQLYGYGYSADYENGEPMTPEIEGSSQSPALIKLKGAQISPGFSGAPLLNQRTGGVCGIVRRSRDRTSDLGGRATPISVVFSAFPELQRLQETLFKTEQSWTRTLTRDQQQILGLEEGQNTFKLRVGELYRLLHYSVDADMTFGGWTVDYLIDRQLGDYSIKRAIAALSDPPTEADLEKFYAALQAVNKDGVGVQGTIVTNSPVEATVQQKAETIGVQVTQFRDLEAQLLPGESYARALCKEVEENPRYDLSVYIEPHMSSELRGASRQADELLSEWLDDPEWQQLTVLGDVGTGKTFLTRRLSYELAKKYIADPVGSRLPVRIDLRNADRQFNFQALVLAHFAETGLSHVTYDVFQHALKRGRLVVLLDGFDEMAARVTPQVTSRNFQELMDPISGGAKVLLTCRTHYFRSRSEEEEVVLGNADNYDSDFARDLFWDLILRRGFKIAYLRPFTLSQVEEYVNRVKGDAAKEALNKIHGIYNLAELCQRPMLLEMIVKSIDKIGTSEICPATLYQVFTDAWIHRDKWRDVLSPDDKMSFLMALARCLFVGEAASIHYSALVTFLETELANRVENPRQLVEIDNEVRTATFLTRDDTGNYGFAHKSYREFFYSRYLHEELAAGNSKCLQAGRLSGEVCGFLVDMCRGASVGQVLKHVLLEDYTPEVSENALVVLYAIGRRKALEAKAGDKFEVHLPVGMKLGGAQLEGVDLEGAVAHNMEAPRVKLSASVLRRVDFRGSDLSMAGLEKSDLRSAKLEICSLQQVGFSEANLADANVSGSKLNDCVLDDANTPNVTCSGAEISGLRVFGKSVPKGTTVSEGGKSSLVNVLDEALPGIEGAAGKWYEDPELYHSLRMHCDAQVGRYRSSGLDSDEIFNRGLVDLNRAIQNRKIDVGDRRMLGPYFRRIIQHLIRDQVRRDGRIETVPLDTTNPLDDIPSQENTLDNIARAEALRYFSNYLKQELSEEVYQAFKSVYLEGQSAADIADKMKLSRPVLQLKLRRTLEWIRRSDQARELLSAAL